MITSEYFCISSSPLKPTYFDSITSTGSIYDSRIYVQEVDNGKFDVVGVNYRRNTPDMRKLANKINSSYNTNIQTENLFYMKKIKSNVISREV